MNYELAHECLMDSRDALRTDIDDEGYKIKLRKRYMDASSGSTTHCITFSINTKPTNDCLNSRPVLFCIPSGPLRLNNVKYHTTNDRKIESSESRMRPNALRPSLHILHALSSSSTAHVHISELIRQPLILALPRHPRTLCPSRSSCGYRRIGRRAVPGRRHLLEGSSRARGGIACSWVLVRRLELRVCDGRRYSDI